MQEEKFKTAEKLSLRIIFYTTVDKTMLMYYIMLKQEQNERTLRMKNGKFNKIFDDLKFFLDDGHKESPIPLFTVLIVLAAVFLCCYYDKPELENYNLKEKLPAPQNEVVVNDRDIAKGIRHQKAISADFNRMYDELNVWKKITWPNQPLDTASWYRKAHPCPPYNYIPTMGEYRKYIDKYETELYFNAKRRSETKYANYKGKQK